MQTEPAPEHELSAAVSAPPSPASPPGLPPTLAAETAPPAAASPDAGTTGAAIPQPTAVPPPRLPPPPLAPAFRPPAAPPPPRRGRGWMVFALVLLAILLLVGVASLSRVLTHIVALAEGGSEEYGPDLQEVLLEDNHASDKLAVLDVEGVIGTGYLGGDEDLVELVRHQLKRAERDKSIKGVLLRVDSPGGEVLASDDISHLITDFQQKTGKPVVASLGALAASGGYYVAVPARWIVAHELTLTGSIGVLMNGYNYRGLMNKVGVRPEIIKSGRFKDMMSPSRADEEIPPEERKMLQALVDETFGRFKQVVAEGRGQAHKQNKPQGRALASDWEQYADGRVLSGKQAYDLGFVDELGSFRAAVAAARRLAKLDRANLVQYRQPFDFTKMFRLFGQAHTRGVKIDLGVEWPRLQPGRLYYLFLP